MLIAGSSSVAGRLPPAGSPSSKVLARVPALQAFPICGLVSLVQPPPAEKAAAHGVRGFFARQKANGDQLAVIADLVIKGTVKVNVETVLPLRDARKAQELSKTGHSGGKIVLEVLR